MGPFTTEGTEETEKTEETEQGQPLIMWPERGMPRNYRRGGGTAR